MRFINLSISIIVIFVVTIMGCSKSNEKANPSKQTVYNQVLKTGEIKVGYISYPPSFIKDPNSGSLSGIFYEVIEAAARNMGLKLNFTEEVSWGTMIEALNTGRVDIVVTGIWPTSSRGKKADFTTPIYYSVVNAYTRIGNTSFDNNIDRINSSDVTISTIDGEMTSIIASSDFPNAKIASLAQTSDISQVLLDVATGKADVSFVEPAIALEYIKNNSNKIRSVEGVTPLRVFPNVMMVNKGETNFLSMLNIAITELINNGYVDKVIDKYEIHPGSFKRVLPPFKQ